MNPAPDASQKKPPPAGTGKPAVRPDKLLQTLDGWLGQLRVLLDKFGNLAKTNYDLGRQHMARGNIQDARLRLKLVVWLEPKHVSAWYYLGCCELDLGRSGPAVDALRRALSLKADHEEAKYMLALAAGRANPAQLPTAMPLSLIKSQFEALAAGYGEEQVKNYGYQGHQQLYEATAACMAEGRADYAMLELGVGSGLCGLLFRPRAARLAGVDLSPAMLAEAGKLADPGGRKTYDALVEKDALSFLKESAPETYDVVYACNVFPYAGELGEVIAAAAAALKPGALLAFSADPGAGESYALNPKLGRFTHSPAYLRAQAARAGFEECSLTEAEAYPGHPMLNCVFRKSL